MSKHFYVYYSYEEFGRGYIGSRGCKCLPEEDSRYYGSFRDKNFNPTQKIILGVYESRKDAYEAEILLHEFYDIARNPHFANRSKMLTAGFSVEGVPIGKGKILSEEHKRKIRESNIGKKRSIEIRKKFSKLREGFCPSKETREKMRQTLCKNNSYKLLDPEGNEHHFISIHQFSSENNLDRTNISRVLNGRQKQYKGWKLPTPHNR